MMKREQSRKEKKIQITTNQITIIPQRMTMWQKVRWQWTQKTMEQATVQSEKERTTNEGKKQHKKRTKTKQRDPIKDK